MGSQKVNLFFYALLVGCSTSTQTANMAKDVTETAAFAGNVAAGTIGGASLAPRVEHQILVKGFVTCHKSLSANFSIFQLELFERDKFVATLDIKGDGGFVKIYRGRMGPYSVRLVNKLSKKQLDSKQFTSSEAKDRFDIALNSCA